MLQSMLAAASTERNLFPEADNLTAFAPNICFICLKRQLKRRAKHAVANEYPSNCYSLVDLWRPQKGKAL